MFNSTFVFLMMNRNSCPHSVSVNGESSDGTVGMFVCVKNISLLHWKVFLINFSTKFQIYVTNVFSIQSIGFCCVQCTSI